MTAHSPHRRWKGCPLCKPGKFKSQGDAFRTPWPVLRKLGIKRRFNRNKVRDDE